MVRAWFSNKSKVSALFQRRAHGLLALLLVGKLGCVHPHPLLDDQEVVKTVHTTDHHRPTPIQPVGPLAAALGPNPVPPSLGGELPLDAYIYHALAENRGVQAARFNLLAMKARIPQERALEDPMVQNTIWPFPSNAPQYSLMGYMPYELMITQQFPWFGTLKLRGQAAEQEAKTAFYELLAAQLEVVARVKRAYYNIYFNQKADAILAENQKLAEDFVVLARERLKSGTTTLQDVLRAENVVTDVESERVNVRQELAGAQAALARQLHVSPESDLRTLSELPVGHVPAQVEMLYHLAATARPELQRKLAAVARDERQVELAKKRYYPNITAGIAYGTMTPINSMSSMADGRDNVGFVLGFNLPIYREKLAAGVNEATNRALADSQGYEDLKDETFEEVKEFYVEAKARREVLELFRSKYLPRAENVLELATNDYRVGNQDFLTLITGLRELLTVRMQIARLESELGKALASLERVVGVQLNDHPPVTIPAPSAPLVATPPQPPPPPTEAGPFVPGTSTAAPITSEVPKP